MQRVLDCFGALQTFTSAGDVTGQLYSLPHLERTGVGRIARLPVCLRIVLESVLRNCDGKRIHEADVRRLAAWQPNAERTASFCRISPASPCSSIWPPCARRSIDSAGTPT